MEAYDGTDLGILPLAIVALFAIGTLYGLFFDSSSHTENNIEDEPVNNTVIIINNTPVKRKKIRPKKLHPKKEPETHSTEESIINDAVGFCRYTMGCKNKDAKQIVHNCTNRQHYDNVDDLIRNILKRPAP